MMSRFLLQICLGWLLGLAAVRCPAAPATNPPAGMVWVPEGLFQPLFRGESDPKEIVVRGFWIDARPVTEGHFLEFVQHQSRWRRSQVKSLFADSGYLKHWVSDLDPGTNTPAWAGKPVVHISWFAAKAYANINHQRLPTTAEWERVAGAGFTSPNGALEPEFQNALTSWYSTPTPPRLAVVGSGRVNYHGIHDLHGLIWEWTSDFNTALGTGDARNDTGLERQLFCGAGSLGATDRANYPAYMREGFRSSLKASYTVHNLGFRCALSP